MRICKGMKQCFVSFCLCRRRYLQPFKRSQIRDRHGAEVDPWFGSMNNSEKEPHLRSIVPFNRVGVDADEPKQPDQEKWSTSDKKRYHYSIGAMLQPEAQKKHWVGYVRELSSGRWNKTAIVTATWRNIIVDRGYNSTGHYVLPQDLHTIVNPRVVYGRCNHRLSRKHQQQKKPNQTRATIGILYVPFFGYGMGAATYFWGFFLACRALGLI